MSKYQNPYDFFDPEHEERMKEKAHQYAEEQRQIREGADPASFQENVTGVTTPIFEDKEVTRTFSYLGMCAFLYVAVSVSAGVLVSSLCRNVLQNLTTYGFVYYLINLAPQYLLALPFAWYMLRQIPADSLKSWRLPADRMFRLFFIAIFILYFGNMVGVAFTPAGNDTGLANAVTNSSVPATILFACVISPLVEEFLFRKLIIDRCIRFGEGIAITVSAFIFALAHTDLSQVFYAWGLGMLFGYIYIRTGRLRYTVILHAAMNFLSTVASQLVMKTLTTEQIEAIASGSAAATGQLTNLSGTYAPILAYAMFLFMANIIGMIFYLFNRRRFRVDRDGAPVDPGSRFRLAYASRGMILYIVTCIILMILQGVI